MLVCNVPSQVRSVELEIMAQHFIRAIQNSPRPELLLKVVQLAQLLVIQHRVSYRLAARKIRERHYRSTGAYGDVDGSARSESQSCEYECIARVNSAKDSVN
uniref:AlNc14C321G10595 protein n=1 Tax=Albugo laibachii Nc14 TaxID=890382 RepID=F0WWG2_9STRA|nr:AlNc14C321G10595 [Albugo laibachii Nc14]|eukprot:CCA25785.1 AlNc14C321G10595 [Albugo laibachii Nc14]